MLQQQVDGVGSDIDNAAGASVLQLLDHMHVNLIVVVFGDVETAVSVT